MITYIDNVKDRTTRRCALEDFHRLTNSEQTKQYIEQYRKTKQADWKHRLPAVLFQGYHPACLRGGNGTRVAKDLVPTGFFLVDFDHLSEVKLLKMKTKGLKPSQAYNLYLSALQKLGLKLTDVCVICHTTPSGDGLRIVQIGRKGSNVIEDQKWLSAAMGLECDKAVKDISRLSFIPRADEIFFQNNELLFGEPLSELYSDTKATGKEEAIFDDEEPEEETDQPSGNYPTEYHGIPYKEIVERLVNHYGGCPQMGERHARIIKLANDLKTITDKTIDWMMEIIPSFGKPRDEKRSAIQWAVQHYANDQSKALQTVLAELREKYPSAQDSPEQTEQSMEAQEQKRRDLIGTMPEMPEKLPALVELLASKVMPHQRAAVASMVFPALSTHIANSWFVGLDRKKFRNTMMCVLTGKQSVGKGCVDEPIEHIIADILEQDNQARILEREWAQKKENKKANEKGAERPKAVIRILNSDVTPAAMLNRLFAAENYGERKNMFTFTKVEEIEELYSMCPTQGHSRITQLIRKCWDVGKIGSERFTSSAANFQTSLAWNWTACGTVEKVKKFFAQSLSDGTVSRVDFATIIAPEEDFEFEYGDYDDRFAEELEPYVKRLQEYQNEQDANGRPVPLRIAELTELEREMNQYIKDYSRTLEDETWKDYAWRTKMIAMKKIIVLYIANGCRWEDTFADFFRWSFHYSMWCKMNLFYAKASEDFKAENFIAERQVRSPLDLLDTVFSRTEFYQAVRQGGFKTEPTTLLYTLKKRHAILPIDKNTFEKAVKTL